VQILARGEVPEPGGGLQCAQGQPPPAVVLPQLAEEGAPVPAQGPRGLGQHAHRPCGSDWRGPERGGRAAAEGQGAGGEPGWRHARLHASADGGGQRHARLHAAADGGGRRNACHHSSADGGGRRNACLHASADGDDDNDDAPAAAAGAVAAAAGAGAGAGAGAAARGAGGVC